MSVKLKKLKNQIEVFKTTLPNGLRLVGEFSPSAESLATGFLVNTGSRDEQAEESGISHFLEHMLFKGTKSYSAIEFNNRLGELGAQANAYTSREHTFYFASILPENLANYLKLLTEMINPTLDPEEFSMEKKVILEEIALYQDDPQSYFYEKVMADYYGSGSVGNSVLGSSESVSALEVSDLRDYINRRYAVDNIVFTIAGKFDWDEYVSMVSDLTSDLLPSNSPRNYSEHSFPGKNKVFTKKDLTLNHLMFILPGVSAQDERRHALSLYLGMLGDSKNSRLYWDLMEPGLVESVYCWSDENDQVGGAYIYAVFRKENQEKIAEIIKSAIQAENFITEKNLELSKVKAASRLAISAELPYNRMIRQAEEVIYNDTNLKLADELAAINSVSLDQVKSIAAKLQSADFGEYYLIKD